MELQKLTFVEVDGTVDGMLRPTDLNYKKSYVDEVAAVTEGCSRLTPARLSKVASGILIPSTDNLATAHIANGWGEKRIMFAMVVLVNNHERSKDMVYIVGHTDKSDFTALGRKVRFDPKMRMYFNSITRVNMMKTLYGSRGETVWQPTIKSHDQILNRAAVLGEGRRRNADGRAPATCRPADLFRRSDSNTRFGGMIGDGQLGANLTGTFTSQLRASNRVNNDPAHMLTKSLSAYAAAAQDPEKAYLGERDDNDVIRQATDSLEENLVDVDPYITELKHQTNILESGWITFGELMEFNPDFDEDRNLAFQDLSHRRNGGRSSHDMANWNNADNETIAATIIGQALPAMMINAMYSYVELTLNTRARMGEPKALTTFAMPFVDGLSVTSTMNYFEQICEDVLLQEVSKGGMFDVEAHIKANIDQEIEIRIRIDNGEEAFYVFPTFADSLIAPTLAHDTRLVDNLSRNLVKLAGDVSLYQGKHSPHHTDTPSITLNGDVGAARNERDSVKETRRDSRPSDRGSKNW